MTRLLDVDEASHLRAGDDHYRAYVGPPQRYDFIGLSQLSLLFMLGLREHHRLLDVGCGSLRLGRMAIPFLLKDRYFGIEPEAWLIEEGFDRELGRDALALKGPRFDHNSDFRADMFGVEFDFIIAQSVFSHTGALIVQEALQNLASSLAPTGLMVTNWWTQSGPSPEGQGWVYPGCVEFSDASIHDMASRSGLACRRIPWMHPALSWYLMARDEGVLPTEDEMATLGGVALNRPE